MSELAAAGATRTVQRALALLAEVGGSGAVSLSECSRRTGLAPSTALRLLRTLEGSGFVGRGTDGSYRPGGELLRIGALALGRQPLVTQVRPSLQHLVERTGESAYFVIRGAGDTALYLDMVEGTHAIRHTSWVGRAIELADLAVGRALHGEVPAAGYTAERDRLEPDVTAIAAPVRWAGGVAGALNLLGPTYRIDDPTLHRFGAIVAAEAEAIGRRIGATAEPRVRLEEVP